MVKLHIFIYIVVAVTSLLGVYVVVQGKLENNHVYSCLKSLYVLNRRHYVCYTHVVDGLLIQTLVAWIGISKKSNKPWRAFHRYGQVYILAEIWPK